jgi:hypothetical protein
MGENDFTARTVDIPLTKGYVAIVDEVDSDLGKHNWYAHITPSGRVYARRNLTIDGKRRHVWLHKVIFCRASGILFPPEIVDHKDNKLNLRTEGILLSERVRS